MTRTVLPAAVLLVLLAGACQTCPPGWGEHVPDRDGFLHAAAASGEVFVDADRERLALVRAARSIADQLGMAFEKRLSVVNQDGRLWVEAVGVDGVSDALDRLELVRSVDCDGRLYVLVRLPVD